MAHRRGGSFRRGGISDSQRRKKTWISAKAATAAVGGGDASFMTALQITLPAPLAGLGDRVFGGIALFQDPTGLPEGGEVSTLPEESTILRARGSLLFPKSDPTSGVEPLTIDQQSAFGIGVTDVRSLSAGVFPTPIIDSDWDGWMFLRQSTVLPVDAIGTVVDIKSMRKIMSGDALFFAAETINGASTGGTATSWTFDMRFLILLP